MDWEDFARYVADYGHFYQRNLDEHFKPIVEICNPCTLPFNFIAKLDTLDEGISSYGFSHSTVYTSTSLG